MRHNHFEVVRFTLLKKLDFKTSFAIWRLQDPWQPITKKVFVIIYATSKSQHLERVLIIRIIFRDRVKECAWEVVKVA